MFDSVLRSKVWPSVEEVRQEVKAYLGSFVPRDNVGELAFLLLRQRRAISPWSQQLLPPGHVAVCPYLDFDYLRLLLDFSSVSKHAKKFQRACLREFWPQLPVSGEPGRSGGLAARVSGARGQPVPEVLWADAR